MRRMLDVDIPVNRRRRRPNLRCKVACKRDMTEAGLKEENTMSNRYGMEEEAKLLYRRPQMTGHARNEEEEHVVRRNPSSVTSRLGEIFCTAQWIIFFDYRRRMQMSLHKYVIF